MSATWSITGTYGRAAVQCWWFNTREFPGVGFTAPYVVTVDLEGVGCMNYEAVIDDFGNLVMRRVPS